MKRFLIILACLLIATGIGWYFYDALQGKSKTTDIVTPAPEVDDADVDQEDENRIKYPVTDSFLSLPEGEEARPGEQPTQEPATDIPSQPMNGKMSSAPEPLPALDESDETLEQAIIGLITEERFRRLFISKSLIRHIVVTVDNMTAEKLPQKFKFNEKLSGRFLVNKESEEIAYIDTQNYQRYTPFVVLTDLIDTRDLVSIYVRYYKLFQEAYEDLGFPNRYFNDRLVEVIDHLLSAPEVKGPIKLVRPKVFYNFADPELEALSAGQKIMVRMGVDNARKVKAKLRELRNILVTLGT